MGSKKRFYLGSILGLCLVLLLSVPSPIAATKQSTEILWDSWGVPHIFAKDREGMFRAFGWAQMQSHGNEILRLYGTARGRGAEYWGEKYLESDRLANSMGFPESAKQAYAAQTEEGKNYLDAFAAGMNAYAEKHPDRISEELKKVLPVKATDSLALADRLLFSFLTVYGKCYPGLAGNNGGSNAWAIAPKHSASGRAMLLANPHLPWSGSNILYETQLVAPGIDAYGVAPVGIPALVIAFNDYLGWATTYNTFDGCDRYQLKLADGGYLFDGRVRPFETESKTLKVLQNDGSLREEKLKVRRSIQGVVLEREGVTFAIRIVGLDRFAAWGLMQQYWDMMAAKNLRQFQTALKRLQMPFTNILYGDRNGHIMYLFNGQLPVRSQGDWNYWQGIVPGDTSKTLWTKIHPYSELPKVIDPPSGWVQNANDPPWTSTFPQQLNSKDFPPYTAPQGMSLRAQRSARMLAEDRKISFEELIEDKYSTRMELADRLLDDLIAAANQYGSLLTRQAVSVLTNWDRKTDADSRGALLFSMWWEEMGKQGGNIFATPWDEKNPLTTPKGLANPQAAAKALEIAATKIKSAYGTLDVPWGDVMRFVRGKVDFPGNGGNGNLGIFRVIGFFPGEEGRYISGLGDSYIAAIEFSNPIRAKVLSTYGNSSRSDSPHYGDQLKLAARKELRPAWRSRGEIEAHLESRQVFSD